MSNNSEELTLKEKIRVTFHNIFSMSHAVYSITFFVIMVICIFLSFNPIQAIANVVLFIVTTFALTFLFLIFIGRVPQMEKYLFSEEKKEQVRKVVLLIIIFVIAAIIITIYFFFGSSSQLPIEFLGWDIILPYFYIILYFGWNLIQIFFIKSGFENLSINMDDKFINNNYTSKKTEILSLLFLIIALIIPILIQIGTYFGFLYFFAPQPPSYSSEYLYWYIGWNVVVFIIIALTSSRLIYLFIRSRKNNTPNIFSSVFYVLIWLVIWFRSFSFINSFRSVTFALSIDIFRAFIDVMLMILTAFLVLTGLGKKIYRFRIFNKNTITFFLFAFTLIYIEGQIIMITGAGLIPGTYTSRNDINLLNNFLVLLVTLIFYWWYAKYILERKGLIYRKNFTQSEVITIVHDFKDYLINSGALQSDKISDWEFRDFFRKKNMDIEKLEILDKKKTIDNNISQEDNTSAESDQG